MQFKQRARKADSEDGILPLINVVFLLLIFFMLAGRLTQAAPFSVEPPASAEAGAALRPGADQPREATMLVSADGRMALNGTPLDPAALRQAIAGEIASRPDLPVILKADGAAEASAVVAVMERLRDAGVRRLQLFTQPLPDQRGP
jgi:biopolymer transport protein ExbD